MNAIELYKILPRKNCGKCGPGSCMPFALALLSGRAELSECPLLTDDEKALIGPSFTGSDWREELIAKLAAEVRDMDLRGIAEGIGADIGDGELVIRCMGREFRITSEGDVAGQGHLTLWMKILLLHYVRTAGSEALTGKWTSYDRLKAGIVKASSFRRECEEPLRAFLDRSFEKTEKALLRMGGKKSKDFPADSAWLLHLLPKMPVAILYWRAEEEFPSQVKILFDSTADRFLDAESIIFLLEGLAKNIEMALSR